MSNQCGVAMRDSVIRLKGQGRSNRAIAKALGIHRDTVNRFVREYVHGQNRPNLPTGSSGPCSECSEYKDLIVVWLENEGFSARRIHQELVSMYGFPGSYCCVKRYIRRLLTRTPIPFRRIEVPPGMEAQVDFGQGAPTVVDGKTRRPHVLCVTLSNSRYSYQEAVLTQTTENFIRALENAFRSFGGVPGTVVTDNLKAAVIKADWHDPELNPKILDFARHYNTVILPTRPAMPRHKGKVESMVKYVQNSALKGRKFSSLSEQNEHLREWNRNVAATRVHGTTKKQVRQAFDAEKPHLLELPCGLFPCFEEGSRKVHRDGYIEVCRSYYSVPDEYCQRDVWARWDGRMVRVFNHKFEQVAIHARVAPGRFSTDWRHIPEKKIASIEKGPEWILSRAREIGPHVEAWVRATHKNRGLYGLRPSIGLLSLVKKHDPQEVDAACSRALAAGEFKLRAVKKMLGAESEQPEFEFMGKHPLIRDMGEYGRLASWEG